jgi:hypothetical protein
MVALYDGDQDLAISAFERYLTVPDPWMRAMARLYRGAYISTLGTMEGVEDDCRAALADFRTIGDHWGMSIALAQLVEYTELRGDHAASIAALQESAQLGRRLGTWADLAYIDGRLATVWARAGDIDRAWRDWARAEETAARTAIGYGDSYRWLGLMRAEIAWHAGDAAEVARCCAEVLDGLDGRRAPWWAMLRAQVGARLAMVALINADTERARHLLHGALADATSWVERPPVAAVIDATAAYVLAAGRSGDSSREVGAGRKPGAAGLEVAKSGVGAALEPEVGAGAGPESEAAAGPQDAVATGPEAGAAVGPQGAAMLLGAGHGVRGAFDESSLDAARVRAAAREALGEAAFAAAYQRGRDLDYDAAVALVRQALG